jgi:hypothetical protein
MSLTVLEDLNTTFPSQTFLLHIELARAAMVFARCPPYPNNTRHPLTSAQSTPRSDPHQVPVPRPWGTQSDQEMNSSQINGENYALSRWLQEPASASPYHNIAFVDTKASGLSTGGNDARGSVKNRNNN